MRVPIPTNRLVALTLAGALLTTLAAGALAFPGLGLVADQSSSSPSANVSPGEQLTADEPTPNQNFTPAAQTQPSGGEYEEEDDHEEEEDEKDDHEEEEDEKDDHEEEE